MGFGRLRRSFYRSFARAHNTLLIRTHGRPSHLTPRLRALVLVTLGRVSGVERPATLAYLPEGDDFIVVASNFGSEQPPAWWRNLEAQPGAHVFVNGKRIEVHARALEGADRDRVLARAVQHNKQWRSYVAETAREIPIVLLERTNR